MLLLNFLSQMHDFLFRIIYYLIDDTNLLQIQCKSVLHELKRLMNRLNASISCFYIYKNELDIFYLSKFLPNLLEQTSFGTVFIGQSWNFTNNCPLRFINQILSCTNILAKTLLVGLYRKNLSSDVNFTYQTPWLRFCFTYAASVSERAFYFWWFFSSNNNESLTV